MYHQLHSVCVCLSRQGLCESIIPLIHSPAHLKTVISCITAVIPASTVPSSVRTQSILSPLRLYIHVHCCNVVILLYLYMWVVGTEEVCAGFANEVGTTTHVLHSYKASWSNWNHYYVPFQQQTSLMCDVHNIVFEYNTNNTIPTV